MKEIHVRGLDVDWQVDYCAVMFCSSLVNDGPIGSGFAGQNLDNSTSVKNIRYVFNTPRDINGTYLFTYTPIDSVNGTSSINYGYAVFSLEFIASWIYLASSSKPCHIQSSASCVSSQPRGLRP